MNSSLNLFSKLNWEELKVYACMMQNLCSLLSDLWKDLSYSSTTTIYGWMNFRTPTTEIVAAVLFHTASAANYTEMWSRTVLLLFSIRIFEKSILHWHIQKLLWNWGEVRFPKWYVSMQSDIACARTRELCSCLLSIFHYFKMWIWPYAPLPQYNIRVFKLFKVTHWQNNVPI